MNARGQHIMEQITTRILRGANRWARVPVFEIEVKDGACANRLAHLFLTLQQRAGSPVEFQQVVPLLDQGRQRVIVEFEEEKLAQACLEAALGLLDSGDDESSICAVLPPLKEIAHDVRLGPSTGAIVRAALSRGIPFRRLGTGSLVVLGHGAKQRRICTAETDATSAIAETIAQDKDLTRLLLHSVGVPVPEGRPVRDAADAWEAARELGLPVVVKPRYGNHGRGVATNLSTREQVDRAYAAAREESSNILVEQHIQGDDYRLLVIGGQLVAAALREPAHVVGDGRSTIRQLVAEANRDPRRSDGHGTVLSFIKLDAIGLQVLEEQGCTPDSVPRKGQRVLIRRNGNLSTGGTATDVTDRVHPDIAARACDAAKAVGLDIAGVDLVALDVRQTMEEQRAAVVEVNAGPGLRMHLEPSAGKPRPVGKVIVDMLFPPGEDGRIPIVAITGSKGKTTTTRLLAQLFEAAGHVVGMACSDGMYLAGRPITRKDCSGADAARSALLNPNVTAAVLETAAEGILREGLGFDRCTVAVVVNQDGSDSAGWGEAQTIEEPTGVQRVVVGAVEATGAAILNADDRRVRALADHCPGEVIFFSRQEGRSPGESSTRRPSRMVHLRKGVIHLSEGAHSEVLLALDEVLLTQKGQVAFQVENTLAAVGAAWAAGFPLDAIRAGLRSFH